jgi:hypothetical protein
VWRGPNRSLVLRGQQSLYKMPLVDSQLIYNPKTALKESPICHPLGLFVISMAIYLAAENTTYDNYSLTTTAWRWRLDMTHAILQTANVTHSPSRTLGKTT